ncbi:MAG: NAD(P)/FAD-dependent oxidoreductase [Hyphomicrobium aestuarii]|nr:NAD(P)/FAD-dependent oxidoreductase [Hyphomicrobium aestuarii]
MASPRTTRLLDAIIIGGGHNGLTCAAYLARAGRHVLVIEKNAVAGGAATTEEFHPGFKNSVASYAVSLLNPRVIADLELARFGLSIIERPVANFWPIDGSRGLLMPYGLAGRQQAIAAFSKADAARLSDYDAALERAARVLRGLVLETPPNAGAGWLELLRSGAIARPLLRVPLADQRLLIDLFTKSAADFLSAWFESEIVKGAFAFDGIVGAYASPYTPGTAYVLLHHCFGEVNGKTGVWGHAVGGMGAISAALQASAEASSAIIRTRTAVRRVIVRDGRATGVELDTGEVITARCVVSGVGPKLLFRDLVAPDAVEPALRARFIGLKSGSGVFRMNVALSELPDFRCRPGLAQAPHHGAGIVIGPTLDYLDRSFTDARHHGWARQPVVEILIPSTIDPSLAPPGHHVASLFVQHVAPHLADGRSWDDAAPEFADLAIATVTAYAPNFAASILARQVLSPLDLERRYGLLDGDIFHGQLTLGQLFSARPVLGHAAYRMPVAGLYLCGSGAHPGGGVTGVPGRNAAREIIRDLQSSRLFASTWPNGPAKRV